ncbi:MAG TPA: hypothetical protein PKE45_00410 [Caldilineaceae bacterium]|nr:hypothetical protein [Caldilineaceae bacterium]
MRELSFSLDGVTSTLIQNPKQETCDREQYQKAAAKGTRLSAAFTCRARFRLWWFASARQMFPDIILDHYPACTFADSTGRHVITSQLFWIIVDSSVVGRRFWTWAQWRRREFANEITFLEGGRSKKVVRVPQHTSDNDPETLHWDVLTLD